ncbi:MAG: phospho-sugar mutase [Lachnospiraceae bacterium]|nr:phospho-sugar mutase [Lachnospiraceae bacterium]
MDKKIQEAYERWLKLAVLDSDLIEELRGMDEDAIADAFYRDLEFGTGGLRGVLGAGSNRMNVYTVGKASQGLANYVLKHFPEGERRIAVSYDSRIKSILFSRTASAVFAANGIETVIYKDLMPTPCLSYAVRALKCSAGIMVTASHNPAKYNGYKVYGPDGCQCATEAAGEILSLINELDCFDGVKFGDFDELMAKGAISYIPDQIYTDFVAEVRKQSVLPEGIAIDKNVAVVYTPLYGAGRYPVIRTLTESGFTNITVVKEQAEPNGNFPTCPYPNPEIREAMQLGIETAEEYHADLLMATDPDSDRLGIAVRNDAGEYVLLSGNETGCLLLDYILNLREQNGTLPKTPVVVKTIVTTDLADQIAKAHGAEVRNVLTGFKYIGEQILDLENHDREGDYIFGFEESYGYLTGTYVRDKDAVDAAFMVCEMFAYYRSIGKSLLQRINELYDEFGYYQNSLKTYEFEGMAGAQRMQEIMASFRGEFNSFAGIPVAEKLDYLPGINGLPKADVVKFYLTDGTSLVIRPSGTEPKVKLYIAVKGKDREATAPKTAALIAELDQFMK